MAKEFSNKQDWFHATLAFVIWFLHFSLLWAASSIFPDQPQARWIALILTIAAATAFVWLWRRASVRTVFSVPGLGIGFAAVASAFTAAAALVG